MRGWITGTLLSVLRSSPTQSIHAVLAGLLHRDGDDTVGDSRSPVLRSAAAPAPTPWDGTDQVMPSGFKCFAPAFCVSRQPVQRGARSARLPLTPVAHDTFPATIPGAPTFHHAFRRRVCISGYDSVVRAAIQHSLKTVGGQVGGAAMTRRDTHLILPLAKGATHVDGRECCCWQTYGGRVPQPVPGRCKCCES